MEMMQVKASYRTMNFSAHLWILCFRERMVIPFYRNSKKFGIPVIFLTAKADVTSKVKGLKDGAEDYIVKPFEMLEVMVRLEKVLDRYGTAPKQIQIDDVIIDTVSHIVTKNGEEIYLKPMEYNCLMVFVKNPNKALTRSQILQELWKEEFCGETRTVDAHVGRIRKKTKLAG